MDTSQSCTIAMSLIRRAHSIRLLEEEGHFTGVGVRICTKPWFFHVFPINIWGFRKCSLAPILGEMIVRVQRKFFLWVPGWMRVVGSSVGFFSLDWCGKAYKNPWRFRKIPSGREFFWAETPHFIGKAMVCRRFFWNPQGSSYPDLRNLGRISRRQANAVVARNGFFLGASQPGGHHRWIFFSQKSAQLMQFYYLHLFASFCKWLFHFQRFLMFNCCILLLFYFHIHLFER